MWYYCRMKKILCILCFVFCTAVSFAAEDEKFVDCGRGYTMASWKSTHGIPTFICHKVWCMDLENGKHMGSSTTPNKGYENTNIPNELCDNSNPRTANCIECFGKRKWCSGEASGAFNPDVGAYTKGGTDNVSHRGVLVGDCYKWQSVDHHCASDEVALHQGGDKWTCLKQSSVGSNGHSAIKSRALRRTAGPAPAIKKR